MFLHVPAPIYYVVSHYDEKETEELGLDQAVREGVENVLDIIKSRITSRSIEQTCTSLREQLWELRWQLMVQLDGPNRALSLIKDVAQKEIVQSSFNDQFELDAVKAHALELYYKILVSMQSRFADEISKVSATELSTGKTLYSTLKLFSSEINSPEVAAFIDWLNSSLDFECSLIITELTINGQVKIDIETQKEVGGFLRRRIVDMAFTSTLLGFWAPDDEDETALVRNVKILMAQFEMSHHHPAPTSIEELKKLLAA